MGRTQRLLNLLQILRSYRFPVSGKRLAERLGISIRTLYRDIAALQAQGAEIEGEVGMGYILKPTFFLPPLMFNQTEMQALLLGMQWVSQFGDAPLSQATSSALNKIYDVLPTNLKKSMHAFTLRVGPPMAEPLAKEDLSLLRTAIAKQNKISICYKSPDNKKSEYILWPFTIGYFTDGRILVAWCEKQRHYRHFKTTQIISIKVLEEHYPGVKEKLFYEWQALQLQKLGIKPQ